MPGYFTQSAATAIASGTMNSTAASTHSVTDPGPACAAAGIHRVPTMHAIANSVTSRSPSSRFKAGPARTPAEPSFPLVTWPLNLRLQLDPDPPQSLRQKFRLAAQPHP